MCFITINDLIERLQKPDYRSIWEDLLCLEVPPEVDDSIDDSWPMIAARTRSGRRVVLWTIYGRGEIYRQVTRVIADFNEELEDLVEGSEDETPLEVDC